MPKRMWKPENIVRFLSWGVSNIFIHGLFVSLRIFIIGSNTYTT